MPRKLFQSTDSVVRTGPVAGAPVQARSCPLYVPVGSCLLHVSVDFALNSRDGADPSKSIICFSAIIFCRAKSPPLCFLCGEGCCCERLVFRRQRFRHGNVPDRAQSHTDTVVRRALARFTSEEPEDLSIAMKGLWHFYKYLKKCVKALSFSSFFETVQKSHEGLWPGRPSRKERAALSITEHLQILPFPVEGNCRPVSSRWRQVGGNQLRLYSVGEKYWHDQDYNKSPEKFLCETGLFYQCTTAYQFLRDRILKRVLQNVNALF